MSTKQFNTRVQHKIDTYENWSKAENFTPLLGELIIYTTNENGDAETKIKIGDGKTKVNDLDFAAGGSSTGETDTGATQSDWAQTDTTKLDYIKNKPGDKKITTEKNLLKELIIEGTGSTSNVPGMYTWESFENKDKDYQDGDEIILTILPDNIVLKSTLYTDEIADQTFGLGSTETGHYAGFNLTSENILEAYASGLQRADETIPYGLAVMVNRRPNLSLPFAAYVVSAEDNLENKIVILEVVKSKEEYIKLSNNALNIDLEPIENSDNLISSGAVYNAISQPVEIPEITNIDEAIETGEYYYRPTEDIKMRVEVTKMEHFDHDILVTLISQTIYIDCLGDSPGIAYRLGYKQGTDEIDWSEPIRTITTEDFPDSVNKGGCVLTSDTGGHRYWDKPKYVPSPSLADIGKVLTAISGDQYSGYSWKELDTTLKLPVVQDVAGFTELDKTVESGIYKYIADNDLECILIVSEYEKILTIAGQEITGKTVTQTLIKTTGTIDLSKDNLGRGLVGPGIFIRVGVGNNQYGELDFTWEEEGKFRNIHDLPQAPTSTGYYLLNSNKDDNDEFYYDWVNLSGDPMNNILTEVSNQLQSKLQYMAKTNESNTFATNQTINGNLTVNGSIVQEGDNYITHAEHVHTEDDYIVLRSGATTPLANYAGFEIQNYDGNNKTGHLVFDNAGTARVGDLGEEEPLTTRAEEDEIVEGTIATWGLKNGAPVLNSGIAIVILTQEEYDATEKDNNTLYLVKEG